MKIDFSDAMAHSTMMLVKAESILKQSLTLKPSDEKLLWSLAETLRQLGKRSEATEYYQRLLKVNPNHIIAKHLCHIFKEEPIDKSLSDSFLPTPFVRIDNFLSEDELQIVWQEIEMNKEAFQGSLVADNQEKLNTRRSKILFEENLTKISPFFFSKLEEKLKLYWDHIAVESFSPTLKEIQLTMSLDGEFFKIHRDTGEKKPTINRKVTFVYYFHSTPQKFSGGDLLLFDTNRQSKEFAAKYTRMAPTHNSLLLFPSECYHQVTPVTVDSEDFHDGRFTLNGWLHS